MTIEDLDRWKRDLDEARSLVGTKIGTDELASLAYVVMPKLIEELRARFDRERAVAP